MPQREIKLESAAFLDSEQAQSLRDVKREDVRKIVDRFLSCAFDELGIAPRFLDGEGMHAIVGHHLPAHFGKKDPLGPAVVPVLRAYVEFLEQSSIVSHAFEIKHALESTADEFEHSVRSGEVAHHAPHTKEKPFVHTAQKTGRNDPCPCGSGRKFKQCCAKLAR
jgi:SEC-C motif